MIEKLLLYVPNFVTVVAILLPAPLISKAVAKPSAFGFKFGGGEGYFFIAKGEILWYYEAMYSL